MLAGFGCGSVSKSPSQNNVYYPVAALVLFLTLAAFAEEGSSRFRGNSVKGKNFDVAAAKSIQPLGEYPARRGNSGETLSEFLLRHKYFKIGKDWKTLVALYDKTRLDKEPNIKKIWAAFNEMREVMRNHPDFALSLASSNIYVTYADYRMTTIDKVILADAGASQEDDKIHFGAATLEDYLSHAKTEIETYIRDGSIPEENVSFDEMQKSRFLAAKTLRNETIRVYGLTPEINEWLDAEIGAFLKGYGRKKETVFYFGSRVMPRSEVAAREGADCDFPVKADGVVKNSVRVTGLNISDLEMIISVSGKPSLNAGDYPAMKKALLAKLNAEFRRFPLNPDFVYVPANATLEEQFKLAGEFRALKGRTLSRYQTAAAPARK